MGCPAVLSKALWVKRNTTKSAYFPGASNCILTNSLHLPWFFSLSRFFVAGRNISISSGTFLMTWTAHNAACQHKRHSMKKKKKKSLPIVNCKCSAHTGCWLHCPMLSNSKLSKRLSKPHVVVMLVVNSHIPVWIDRLQWSQSMLWQSIRDGFNQLKRWSKNVGFFLLLLFVSWLT